jgi:hypothetical protein
MPENKLRGTYRGFAVFDVLDADGKPTGEVTIEGFGDVFPSLAAAQAAIDAHLDQPIEPERDDAMRPR